jgi:hypothetical protein
VKRCPCCGKSNHRLRNCFKYKALKLQEEEEEEEADAKLVIFIGSAIADNEMRWYWTLEPPSTLPTTCIGYIT